MESVAAQADHFSYGFARKTLCATINVHLNAASPFFAERGTMCKSGDTCPDIPIWLKNEVSSNSNIGQ